MENYKYKVCEMSIKYNVLHDSEPIVLERFSQAVSIFREFIGDDMEYQENCYGIILNRMNKVLGCICLGIGTVDSTTVNTKKLLQACLLCNGTAVLLAHNHPSGNTEPSKADIKLTKELKQACKILNITLLDAFIITRDSANDILRYF